MESTRRALILGGSGFLGAHTALAARAAGYEVHVASREPDAGPAASLAACARAHAWDGTSRAATEALLASIRPRAVILTAAMSRVDRCEREPEAAHATNVELPRAAASWCRANGVRLVHVSTDLVFGAVDPSGERYTELDPPSPVQLYGATKAEGEAAALEANPAALVVRLPLLFGDSFGRAMGASDALRAALDRGERPGLFEDEWRAPLDVAVAGRALVELIDRDVAGLLHVAGSERWSRFELAALFCERWGIDVARLRRVRRADFGLEHSRARDATLDASRARALLATPLAGPSASA